MVDASAKLPSGILNGNINQYGDFDQCLSVKPKNEAFESQYCLVSLQLSLPDKEVYLNQLRRIILGDEPYESNFEDVRWQLATDIPISLKLLIFLLGGTFRPKVIWEFLGSLRAIFVLAWRCFTGSSIPPNRKHRSPWRILESFSKRRNVSSAWKLCPELCGKMCNVS